MIDEQPSQLRRELEFLKNCQVRYFLISLAAAGAIVGFSEFTAAEQLERSTFLAPLLVLLPSWSIFFDKATTITRIVGYLRVLELLESLPGEPKQPAIGWENSLALFRERQSRQPWLVGLGAYLWGAVRGIPCLLFQTTQKYWVFNWYAYAGLSAVSLTLAFGGSGLVQSLWNVFALISGITAVHNLSVLGRLVGKGRFSYATSFGTWKKVLSHDAEKYLADQRQPIEAIRALGGR